ATDPYHGHEETAKLCARYLSHVFACPTSPTNQPNPPDPQPNEHNPQLELFIAYALYRAKLHTSVTFTALYLLQRLKEKFPYKFMAVDGRRLFITVFIVASKLLCDNIYPSSSWCIVAQHKFLLSEINRMERELLRYLDWQLYVDPHALEDFKKQVR
ncbi:hypothetical protein FA95DRAFT_1452910, partial [Auriscalpium vulgare]